MSVNRKFEFLRRLLRRRTTLLLLFVGLFIFSSFILVRNAGENDITISARDLAAVDKSALYLVDKKVEFRPGVKGNYEPKEQSRKRTAPGENGEPVMTDNQGASNSANNEFGFDTYVSDKIAMNRSIPDTRPKECAFWHYPNELLKTSVIIVFHNEGWSPLLRTVHSVVNMTPKELLEEVLMVDDFSDKAHLKQRLDEYLSKTFGKTVRLIRNKEREGLIRSRSIGAQNAHGEVVVFLDAHCECNVNWLPPLLAPIVEDRRSLTVPVIDSIDMNTWQYHPQYGGRNELYRGIFEWGLLYKEAELPDEDKAKRTQASAPFNSPTHAGGLFAIDRRWFKKLGYYDPGLQIWGGENFELSFKVWQCGGRVLNVPCSRVGHVYRSHMPYRFGKLTGPIISLNYKRVVEVWMDEYKEYYYAREPFMRNVDAGDLKDQLAIREKNNCKNFSWFMENVAYDIPRLYPPQPPNHVWGEAMNLGSRLCLDTMNHPVPGALGVSSCHGYGGNQMFRLNVKGQMTTGEWCVTAIGQGLTTGRCPFGSVSGHFVYIEESQQIQHAKKGKCLSVTKGEGSQKLTFARCDEQDDYQKWKWKEVKKL